MVKKYNIAYLMHGARNVGGGEYSIYLLIKNLRRDIFEPIVFFSNENEIIKRLREDGIRLINIPLNKRITSVYRDRIKINPVNFFIYFFYLTTGIFQLLTLLKKIKLTFFTHMIIFPRLLVGLLLNSVTLRLLPTVVMT